MNERRRRRRRPYAGSRKTKRADGRAYKDGGGGIKFLITLQCQWEKKKCERRGSLLAARFLFSSSSFFFLPLFYFSPLSIFSSSFSFSYVSEGVSVAASPSSLSTEGFPFLPFFLFFSLHVEVSLSRVLCARSAGERRRLCR